jgi:hypothetical protein
MRSVRSEWRTLSCVLGMALAGLAAPEAWADTTMGFAAA